MKESQHRPSLKTLLQGCILFLPAKLFFQPYLRDVWFMVAAITYDKELGISVHKLASSEMTSLKRRNEGRSDRTYTEMRERRQNEPKRSTPSFARSISFSYKKRSIQCASVPGMELSYRRSLTSDDIGV